MAEVIAIGASIRIRNLRRCSRPLAETAVCQVRSVTRVYLLPASDGAAGDRPRMTIVTEPHGVAGHGHLDTCILATFATKSERINGGGALETGCLVPPT